MYPSYPPMGIPPDPSGGQAAAPGGAAVPADPNAGNAIAASGPNYAGNALAAPNHNYLAGMQVPIAPFHVGMMMPPYPGQGGRFGKGRGKGGGKGGGRRRW